MHAVDMEALFKTLAVNAPEKVVFVHVRIFK
jgi:hypothetical protein